ncbi:hypothetical protein SNE25_00545 [Mucilaginibacter sabulilitoris]|uniref:SMP-30/Gluconolactonase/LRE-like region domain-containing protein n=1 Tax=Mucilaginibacter sabulilitoris TaxID=1173583 RepID=A0ABZ0TP91_9SPHI|nr:hypothetical protein [Mucilaginibacter sabulilitoris]WPU94013.1 hypothetical protein SNE25_00545 [Mucilaginibacter sabulilitoris]
MKTKPTYITCLVIFFIFLVSCQRKDSILPLSQKNNGQGLSSGENQVNLQIQPYTVFNVAGAVDPGNADGTGTTASFRSPEGLQLKPNGILYVADFGNNAIRKVVITRLNGNVNQYTGTVTTLNTPAGPNALQLTHPVRVGVGDDGSINTVFLPDTRFSSGISLGRIYKPSGEIYTTQIDETSTIPGLTKDPTGDFFWFLGNGSLGKFWSGHIQLPNLTLPRDSFLVRYTDHPDYIYSRALPNVIYACPNGVKYLATPNQFYKISANGTVSKIKPIVTYPDLPFESVNDLVTSDDGNTIYFTSKGSIYKLNNGVITTLVEVQQPTGEESMPGDVYAWGLAIDDKQHILYFTDVKSIKILTLPGYVAH